MTQKQKFINILDKKRNSILIHPIIPWEN